jgi:hypothetical protein
VLCVKQFEDRIIEIEREIKAEVILREQISSEMLEVSFRVSGEVVEYCVDCSICDTFEPK